MEERGSGRVNPGGAERHLLKGAAEQAAAAGPLSSAFSPNRAQGCAGHSWVGQEAYVGQRLV